MFWIGLAGGVAIGFALGFVVHEQIRRRIRSRATFTGGPPLGRGPQLTLVFRHEESTETGQPAGPAVLVDADGAEVNDYGWMTAYDAANLARVIGWEFREE